MADRHHICRQRDYRAKAKCREERYTTEPFEASCAGEREWSFASFNLTYHWKSYQHSHADRLMRRKVELIAQSGRRVIVLLAAGLQQFAR